MPHRYLCADVQLSPTETESAQTRHPAIGYVRGVTLQLAAEMGEAQGWTVEPTRQGWIVPQMNTYVAVYFGTVLMAMFLVPVVSRVAKKYHWVDVPGPRKVHSTVVPRIGGIAFVVGLIVVVAVAASSGPRKPSSEVVLVQKPTIQRT